MVRQAHHKKGYIRCTVSSVGADTIVAESDGGFLTIDYWKGTGGHDFSYLGRVVREGMQLNLLDSQTEDAGDGTMRVIPGLVVAEPDFLVDISSLASCFTAYGHHPLLYTVGRLKERMNTQPMLLGNFAGCALDDLINSPETASVGRSLKRAFSEQPVRYCACEDFNAASFKTEAERQFENIREAVTQLFEVEGYEARHALLEPSFVCERLGVQGRVDMMTTDMRLLVEQKAGRNMKIERSSHDERGQQRDDHYVQLLLYYGVLHYNFGIPATEVDTRLLYSHYPASQGLLKVRDYRDLLFEAIRLRNQIVATELLVARQGFGTILPLLNADTIYRDVAKDAQFYSYVLPEMTQLSSQIAALTPLERAYLECMATFLYREQRSQKLGSPQACEEGPQKGIRLAPYFLRGGKCGYVTLVPAESPIQGEPGGWEASCPPVGVTGGTDFRRGDQVWLYSYEGEPDVCRSILYRGSLLDIRPGELTVVLSNANVNLNTRSSSAGLPLKGRKNDNDNENLFKPDSKRLWAVEHSSSDTSTVSSLRGLFRMVTTAPTRRALLLGQRTPQADTTRSLSRSYHPSYDDILLRVRQACDYFLLQGPPGTGKTSMAMRYIVEEELTQEGAGVLLAAYTNRAVDEICDMLIQAELPFLRLGNAASCDPRFHDRLLTNTTQDTLAGQKCLLEQTPVIVGTTSMLQTQPWLFSLKHFTLAVIDEASQILEPSLVGLLCFETIDRFVLVGDQKQLPAVVQQEREESIVSSPLLRDIALDDCRQSLFERLLRWEQRQGRTQFVGQLCRQGRMHPDVARFANSHFYPEEQLLPVPCPHQEEGSDLGYDMSSRDRLDEILKTRRVAFFPITPDTPYTQPPLSFQGEDKRGTENPAEARFVVELLDRVYRFYGSHFDAQKTVGVIVPYRAQIAAIYKEIARRGLEEAVGSITIDTVERYQGAQRDVIIYSFTVIHPNQLAFLTANIYTDSKGRMIDRKLNVALTRARRQMLMTGCTEVMREYPLYRELIDEYRVSDFPSIRSYS